jgi:hypothetical protein
MKPAIRLCAAMLVLCLAGGLAGAALAGLLDSAPSTAPTSSVTPVADRRGTEQTFLTFPEWFLVHSPAEYANYVKTRTPSAFPFLGHIRQFWQGYGAVYDAANDGYPFNPGYHVMILVIGASTTAEYALRSAYETLVGRMSEATQSGGLTPEDLYGARVAQDYVDFIRVKPWYEYDFTAKLAGLWKTTPATGPDLVRKWERRYALTTEYLIKAAYGWLIMKATRAGYDEAVETTVVVLERSPQEPVPQLKALKPLPDGALLASLPRYQAFMGTASALAGQGVGFREIAGNRGPILITVLTNRPPETPWPEARVLFEQPVLTEPGWPRVALVLPVPKLSAALAALHAQGVALEHIYDY